MLPDSAQPRGRPLSEPPPPCAAATAPCSAGDQSRDAHLPLQSINHISRVTADLEEAVAFYRDVLGFILVRRPQSLGCNGAW